MAAEEERLPAVVPDAFVCLSLYVAALAIPAQHACLKVLESREELLVLSSNNIHCTSTSLVTPDEWNAS